MNNNLIFKTLFIGDINVGKTLFINQYINKPNYKNINSISGLNYNSKTISYNNNFIKIIMYNISGEKKLIDFYNLNKINVFSYFLFFEHNNVESFKNIDYWINKIEESSYNKLIFLIGNNIDNLKKKNKIKDSKIKKICKKYNLIYFDYNCNQEDKLTSDQDINKIFNYLYDYIIKILNSPDKYLNKNIKNIKIIKTNIKISNSNLDNHYDKHNSLENKQILNKKSSCIIS